MFIILTDVAADVSAAIWTVMVCITATVNEVWNESARPASNNTKQSSKQMSPHIRLIFDPCNNLMVARRADHRRLFRPHLRSYNHRYDSWHHVHIALVYHSWSGHHWRWRILWLLGILYVRWWCVIRVWRVSDVWGGGVGVWRGLTLPFRVIKLRFVVIHFT